MRQIVEIRDRRDTADNWTSKNPVLADGEHGYEKGTGKFKIGDGRTAWVNLPYFTPVGAFSNAELIAHVEDPTPHPVYDDLPSLTILFENGII